MTLVFFEQEHRYYSLNKNFEVTDYINQQAFEAQHGDLHQYEPRAMISATTFLGRYEDHFDADAVLDKMFAKDSAGFNLNGEPIYTGKNTDYQGCTKAQMKALWDIKRERACDYGTFVHLGAEKYVLEGKFGAPIRPEFRQVQKYIKECGYELDTAEKRIYDEDVCIAGTVDLLMKKETLVDELNGEEIKDTIYYIADWKTNDGKDLADKEGTQWTSMMHFPLCHLKDLPYWHYALQFSLYRWMLEKQGYEFDGQAAVHLKREGNEPQVIEMPYLKDEIEALMELRKQELNKK